MKSQQEMGNAGCFREVKCVTLPRLDQLGETDDSDDAYISTQKASAHKQKEFEFLTHT